MRGFLRRGVFSATGAVFSAGLLAVLVVFAGVYAFLPGAVEGVVARSVQDWLNLERPPEVRLRSDPPPAILLGEFSGGLVVMEGAEFGGLRTRRVEVMLEPFDVRVLRSIWEGELVPEEPISGDLRVVVSEGEISRVARLDSRVSRVDIRPGGVFVGSDISILGNELPFAVRGDLAVSGGRLIFTPGSVYIAGAPLPQRISRRMLEGVRFVYRLEGFPEGTTITGVRPLDDRLLLTGRIEGILG